jgi:phospholipid/cholesterol/gamma-HCH transport system substrate-binding protein
MAAKFSNEIKVGIVVTVAIAALLWGLNYLKGQDIFSSNNEYYAVYDNVNGLVASNGVILNGYKVGQVLKLKFLPDHSGRMVVIINVKSDVFIPRNSLARIVSSDLFGSRVIEIILGDAAEPAKDGDTLTPDTQPSFSDQLMPVKDKAESLIVSIDSLSSAIREILQPKNRQNLTSAIDDLHKTLANLEHASSGIDNLVSQDQSKLNKILGNVESISMNLKNNNEKIGNILKNFSQLSDSLAKSQIASTINNANRTLGEAAAAITRINKGEGSLGLLLHNDSLYNNLNKSSADLDALLIDIKANPKRYVTISVFGGGKSKTPATSKK